MKRLVSIVTMLAVLPAWGDDVPPQPEAIVCNKAGYTKDPAKFHDITMEDKVNTFVFRGSGVVFRDKKFKPMNPALVGLEGLATTYWGSSDQRVLYVYKNEDGQDEVGLSRSSTNSDAGFTDKAVYTDCLPLYKLSALEGMRNGPAMPLSSSSPQPSRPAPEVFRF